MKRQFWLVLIFSFVTDIVSGQSTFKCGWNTYKTAAIVHEYTYSYTHADSFKLYLADSTKTYIAVDSTLTYTIDFPFHDNISYKTANYFNAKKKLVKSEEYKDNTLLVSHEYKYDDKNRKIYEFDDNKQQGSTYKKLFDFTTDKNGDFIINETGFYNNRIEFYTKNYYNKSSVKYKEVRYNDNNKDIVHVENFYYNANGKLKERTVFFPEFKVTKTFTEPGGTEPEKCFKKQAFNLPEKPGVANKVAFMKKLLAKNQSLIYDADCHSFEYKFIGGDYEVVISTTKMNNVKQIVFRYREKLQ